MTLKIEPLGSRKHIRLAFDCGEESLNRYFFHQASQDMKRRVAAFFVLIDDSNYHVLAYYTLSAYTVDISNLNEPFAKQLPRYPLLPATMLGRLAVDQQQQGKRLGELILMDALKRALDHSVQVASLAVITEALNDGAKSFYLKYGFQQFQEYSQKLYLPMKTIAELIKT